MAFEPKPELAVNRSGRTVAGAVNDFATHAATRFVGGARLDIATAFFNLGGYSLLADSLDRLSGARLLLGAEPVPPKRRYRKLREESARPERAARARLNRALENHERDLAGERDLMGFTLEAETAARRLAGWLRSPQVRVRRLERRFLHGKAFLIADDSHGVLAGSSNFTRAGLATNAELNLGNYSPHTVRQVREWFDELWDEAVDYDLAALFEARFEPHPPYLVYLRMLWEMYGDELVKEAEAGGAPQIHLTSFQSDGLWRARRILDRHNGVLIADEVGLGKTYLAGELIREASIDRRQRVLVIAPATLRDGLWQVFLSKHNLLAELVSYQELMADNRVNPDHATRPKLKATKINDYAMVVIDEAHNLRNPATQRAEALRRLLAGSPPKKLVLLTATPVNNSLWDLYHQLGYFLRNDAAFADSGIPSMRDHFRDAMKLNPDDLTPEHLFDVLDAVAVRRTRSFVKRWYPNDTVPINGQDTTITFPTPRVRKVSYDLDAVLPGFFDRIARALDPQTGQDDPESLSLARYAPSMCRLAESPESYELQLAGLLRSGLLKRFESSPHAFATTCERMANSHDAFLSLLDQGRVATGDALADWIATDSDDLDQVDDYLGGHLGLTDDAARYDTERLRRLVAGDRDLLWSFAETSRTVTRSDDPTLAELVEQLAAIVAESAAAGIGPDDTRNRRKVLIFSYFADTVDWVYEHLAAAVETDERLAPYRGRVASLSGSSGTKRRKEEIVWGFAPLTADAREGRDEDRFDIVVTTDVLAEGVNLQQARHIINYDLPWNPMRLVQRHGRIDRIGSLHSEVSVRCVFPDERLDDLLNLEERLHVKIKQAAASIGVGEVLPRQTGRDITYAETREEIQRLRREEAGLFERGGTARGALSGEEYRQELRQAVEQGRRDQIERLPWGSGSGMEARVAHVGEEVRPGYVFCVRIGDWGKPVFRYVELGSDGAELGSADDRGGDGDEDELGSADDRGVDGDEPGGGTGPVVTGDTLACLYRARPPDGFDTPRRLDEATHQRAFTAWETALSDIVKKWNHLADKANLEPRIPRALARAAQILRIHSPADLPQDEIDRAIDSLSAPYPERTIRTIRAAMRGAETPAEQAENILGVIRSLGLEPYTPPEPLPVITAADVHLVCWLALV